MAGLTTLRRDSYRWPACAQQGLLRYGLQSLIIISNFMRGHSAKPWSLAAMRRQFSVQRFIGKFEYA
jgi:hypothetical protein